MSQIVVVGPASLCVCPTLEVLAAVDGRMHSAVVTGQEHCEQPREQWLAGMEAGIVSSLGGFALYWGGLCCAEAGRGLTVTWRVYGCVLIRTSGVSAFTGLPVSRCALLVEHLNMVVWCRNDVSSSMCICQSGRIISRQGTYQE